MSDLYRFVKDDYARTALNAKAVEPVEPVGTLTVRRGKYGAAYDSRILDALPDGKYLIVPKPMEADDDA